MKHFGPLLRRSSGWMLFLAAIVLTPRPALAHDVTPLMFTMLPGGSDVLNVKDSTFPVLCSATITVTSTDPTRVLVDGGGSSTKIGIERNFTIHTLSTVVTPQTVDLTVCWVGEHWPAGPCDENNCSSPLIVPVVITFSPFALNNSAGVLNSGAVNDPIDTYTGELYELAVSDLTLSGPMPLFFRRYYASNLRKNSILGDLGSNWRHNFDARLQVVGNVALYSSPTGRVTRFLSATGPSGWSQITHLDTPYQLAADAGQDAVLFDPVAGRIRTFDYTTGGPVTGKLVAVEDGQGRAHTLAYTPAGQLASVSDGLGRTLTFTYNADAIPKIETVSDGTRTVSYQYTDPIDSEYLTLFTDARGGVTTYAYEDTSTTADQALILSKERPELNVPFTQTWYDTATPDASGRVASQTDSNGHTTTLAYDPLGTRETTVTDPLGNPSVHKHTNSGELSRLDDEAGESVLVSNNAKGQRTGLTDRAGAAMTFTYHAPSGRLASVTNAKWGKTTFTYAARVVGDVTLYDLASVKHADGTTQTFTYDAAGHMTSHVDQHGNAATATYDADGNRLTETNRVGGTVIHTYDAQGRRTSSTSPSGNTTGFAYDGLGRPSVFTQADASTRTFSFDAMDHLLSTTDENGNTTTSTFDKNGNPLTIQNARLETLAIGFDGNDRPLSTTNPLGGTTGTTFDALGRVAVLTDENSNATTYGYDDRGRLTTITAPDGTVSTRAYDEEGILTASTTPLGFSTSYSSDPMGHLKRVTTPSGGVRRWTYDAMGRLATRTDELGKRTTLSRDARGLVTGVDAPAGVSTSYARNALGNVTGVTDPLGNLWSHTFDLSGRRTSEIDPLGNSTDYTYDVRDRVDVVTYPGALGTMALGYDPAGNTTSAVWSDGTMHGFAYDAADRLTAATGISLAHDSAGRLTSSNGITLALDPGGRPTTITLAPGKTLTYAYDAADRVTQVTDWAGGVTQLSYDDDGRMTGMTRSNGVDQSLTYDGEGRVLGITEGALSQTTLQRDARGDVTSAVRVLPTAASAAALSDETLAYDAASNLAGAVHDDLGRLTASGADTYGWNLASQLTSYDRGGTTVNSTYDAAGLRLTRSEGGTTRSYVWNFDSGVPSLAVEREAGADLFYYVRLPGGRLLYSMAAADDARSFYHFDESGNTRFVTDDTGTVVASYAYSPFGRLLSSTGVLDNPFTWGGQHGVMSEGDDFYYMLARYYDGKIGRFLSRDPVRSISPQGVNPFQYAFANPVRYVDRTGLTPERVEDLSPEDVTRRPDARQVFTQLFTGKQLIYFWYEDEELAEKREDAEALRNFLRLEEAERTAELARAYVGGVATTASLWVEASAHEALTNCHLLGSLAWYSRPIGRSPEEGRTLFTPGWGPPPPQPQAYEFYSSYQSSAPDNRAPLGTSVGTRYLNGAPMQGSDRVFRSLNSTPLTVWRDEGSDNDV